MSLETTLFGLLGPLVSNRVYPDVAPNGATRPYITWQQIGGAAPTYIEKGLPDIRNAEIQVNVWGTTRAAANVLALSVEEAIVQSTALDAKPIGAFVADYDEIVDLYGTRQDFSVWASR